MITRDMGLPPPYNPGSKHVLRVYEEYGHTLANKKDRVQIDSSGIVINEKLRLLSNMLVESQRSGNELAPGIVDTR